MADAAGRHADHDPLLVASLLDGDLTDADRAIATGWVETCASCASLRADLLALSVATRTQPAPARPRDFRLTAADATRLRAEPAASEPRLTGVMTDTSSATAHRTHDTTLVASLTDHSLAPSERVAAEALVAACTDCAALHADLLALVAATRAMPTPPRPIDYTLTPAHAARLRPNPWRRLVAAVGSTHDGVIRPLAIGLSTLGLVGVLLASAPTILQSGVGGGSATSGAGVESTEPIVNAAPGAATDTSGDGAPAAQLAPTAGGAAEAGSSSAPDRSVEGAAPVFGAAIASQPASSDQRLNDGIGKTGQAAAPAPSAQDPVPAIETTQAASSAGVDPLLLISTGFLVVGLGLFVLRWSARRLADR